MTNIGCSVIVRRWKKRVRDVPRGKKKREEGACSRKREGKRKRGARGVFSDLMQSAEG